ncbi:hypothetical protein COBT_001844 [Conglomerata obtusa]
MIVNIKCLLYAFIYRNSCKPTTELTKTHINIPNDIQSTTMKNPTISDLHNKNYKFDLSDLENILSSSRKLRQKKYDLGLDTVDETTDKYIPHKDEGGQVYDIDSESATFQLKSYLFTDPELATNFFNLLTDQFPGISELTIERIQKPNEQELEEISRLQKMIILQNEISLLNADHGLYDPKLRIMSYNYGKNIIKRTDENLKVYKEFALKLRDLTNELIYKKVFFKSLLDEQLSLSNLI